MRSALATHNPPPQMIEKTEVPGWAVITFFTLHFSVLIALIVFVTRRQLRTLAHRESEWRRFAVENRLEFRGGDTGMFARRGPAITGRVGDLELALSTFRRQVGKHSQTWVLVSARGACPPGTLRVESENVLTRAGRLFGASDIQIGHEAFDSRFRIQAEPETLAREVFDADLRGAFEVLPRGAQLSHDGETSELRWRAHDDDAAQLEQAVMVLARLRAALRRVGARHGSP